MLKKILVVVCLLCLSIPTTVFAKDLNSYQNTGEITKEEFSIKLKETFPELEDYIDNADNVNTTMNISSLNYDDSKVKAVYREKKYVDDEEIGITLLSDGSYIAYSLYGTYVISGGNNKATLTVVPSLYQHPITIHPVSYTIVKGGYDYFTEKGMGVSFLESIIQPTVYQKKETSSSPAYQDFICQNIYTATGGAASVYIKIAVGGDQFKVYCDSFEL